MNKNRKLILGIAAVALLIGGGAGYFTGAGIEKSRAEVVIADKEESNKTLRKSLTAVFAERDALTQKNDTCIEYVGKSEEVVQGLLNALDVSTAMISTPNDIGTMMAYTGTGDGIMELLPTKLIMEDLAVECRATSGS